MRSPSEDPAVADGRVLAGLLLAFAAVTAVSLATSTIAQPGAPGPAPWCLPDQAPEFRFGFASLAENLGGIMGQPTECEHGDRSTGDTLQQTTTGLAVYRWCTNTPSFNQGQDHWILLPGGSRHWTDQDPAPDPPIVRVRDLRHPCPP